MQWLEDAWRDALYRWLRGAEADPLPGAAAANGCKNTAEFKDLPATADSEHRRLHERLRSPHRNMRGQVYLHGFTLDPGLVADAQTVACMELQHEVPDILWPLAWGALDDNIALPQEPMGGRLRFLLAVRHGEDVWATHYLLKVLEKSAPYEILDWLGLSAAEAPLAWRALWHGFSIRGLDPELLFLHLLATNAYAQEIDPLVQFKPRETPSWQSAPSAHLVTIAQLREHYGGGIAYHVLCALGGDTTIEFAREMTRVLPPRQGGLSSRHWTWILLMADIVHPQPGPLAEAGTQEATDGPSCRGLVARRPDENAAPDSVNPVLTTLLTHLLEGAEGASGDGHRALALLKEDPGGGLLPLLGLRSPYLSVRTATAAVLRERGAAWDPTLVRDEVAVQFIADGAPVQDLAVRIFGSFSGRLMGLASPSMIQDQGITLYAIPRRDLRHNGVDAEVLVLLGSDGRRGLIFDVTLPDPLRLPDSVRAEVKTVPITVSLSPADAKECVKPVVSLRRLGSPDSSDSFPVWHGMQRAGDTLRFEAHVTPGDYGVQVHGTGVLETTSRIAVGPRPVHKALAWKRGIGFMVGVLGTLPQFPETSQRRRPPFPVHATVLLEDGRTLGPYRADDWVLIVTDVPTGRHTLRIEPDLTQGILRPCMSTDPSAACTWVFDTADFPLEVPAEPPCMMDLPPFELNAGRWREVEWLIPWVAQP